MESVFKPLKLSEIGPDILHTPFLTEDYCDIIQHILTEKNSWKNEKDHKFATRDIYLESELPDLYSMIDLYLEHEVWPAVAEYWSTDTFKTDTIFAIEYTLDTQRSLKLHHDDSFISASIKLNDDYEGAHLEFPNKEFSNANVPRGDLIIWPSKITHLHRCTELTKGTKYSITIWTKELINEGIYRKE